MAETSGMSEYELKRLERIKANRRMLCELFPEGASMCMPCSAKKRRLNSRRVSAHSQDESASGESTPEKGINGSVNKHSLYSTRYVCGVDKCYLVADRYAYILGAYKCSLLAWI